MPKDSKNGFYRQEQNIGRLISPFCGDVFAARSPPRPVVVHAARGGSPPRCVAWHPAPLPCPLAVRTARAPLR